jgi:heme exporter protein C
MRVSKALGALAAILLAGGVVAALGVAPRDAVQGNVQRIMYIHVPAILTAYVAIAVVLVGSIAYLRGRQARWDRLALASGELAVCFIGLTLATGSIWGKPTWGTWWTWDARLTSTALLFVIYLGYLLLRSVVEDREQAATYAAVLGIVGALDVPIIHFSVQWWRTLHQPATMLRPQAPTMDPVMLAVLLLNLLAFLVTYAYLAARRYRLLRLEADARQPVLG